MIVLLYVVESDELHGGECWVISVGCWVTWWSVGVHGGVLGYMVECWVTWWRVLGYMVESVVLHGGIKIKLPPLNISVNRTFENTTGYLEVAPIIIALLLRHAGMIAMPPWTILSLWKHYSAPGAKSSLFLVTVILFI